tara:strand:+ start:17347 stop:18093 length:747 start_codon:yes stop_codon:yes gene_type:complete
MKTKSNQELICGLNVVTEIIKIRPKSVKNLFIGRSNKERFKSLIEKAEKEEIIINEEGKKFFEENFKDINHQNVALICNKRSEESEMFLERFKEKSELRLLILDGLSDPHNMGACLRSAAAASVDAVIVPKNRSCHLTPTVRRISSGASELIPFVIVTNLVRTIDFLRRNGVTVYGSDLEATKTHDEVIYPHKLALVIGSESKGIRRLTKENCDELIRIRISDKVESLNASVSTGIMLFEIQRQTYKN